MLLLLLACYTEAQFQTDYDDAICEWKAECQPDDVPDADACKADAAASYTSPAAACSFDDAAAAACVDGVQELPCTKELDDGESVEFPRACDEVWTCL
jgi:hypothetical protein